MPFKKLQSESIYYVINDSYEGPGLSCVILCFFGFFVVLGFLFLGFVLQYLGLWSFRIFILGIMTGSLLVINVIDLEYGSGCVVALLIYCVIFTT